jgi:hypothetical protein
MRKNENFDAETILSKINLVTVLKAARMLAARRACQLCSLRLSFFVLLPLNKIVSTAINNRDE